MRHARVRGVRCARKQELFMEFGNPESRDEATGVYSGCSDKGECLIYTEKGDLIGRSVYARRRRGRGAGLLALAGEGIV